MSIKEEREPWDIPAIEFLMAWIGHEKWLEAEIEEFTVALKVRDQSFINHTLSVERSREARYSKDEKMITPIIVCLCGSTRFYDAFQKANYEETMAGRIVLSVGSYPHTIGIIKMHNQESGCTPKEKEALDILHFRKIDLAHEILVLNVDGYIGFSTSREIAYALGHQTKVRFLDEKAGEEYLETHSHKLGRVLAELVDL